MRKKSAAHGLELLSNGVVSMRSLDLNRVVPTKTRDPDAQKLYETNLTVSKAYTLSSFVLFGKHQKTEKHRDEAARSKIFHSAAAHCLSEENKRVILDADKEERNAYLIGLAKIMQQTITYAIPGTVVNHLCDKVLTVCDVHPSDDVKLHLGPILGLTGENSGKSFMHL